MNALEQMLTLALATLAPRMRQLQSAKAIRLAFRAGAPIKSLMPAIREKWEFRKSIALANLITGGLGNPSKMPGRAYGFSASQCSIGSKLAKLANTVCSSCYAMKGRYIFLNVVECHARRFASLRRPLWCDAMAYLINRQCAKVPYFRWHDSGDLQGVWHLANICEVCRMTPKVSHWIPTREYKIVQDFIDAGNEIPPNLQIRLSIHMVDSFTLPKLKGATVTFSSVSEKEKAPDFAANCPAPNQKGECGSCRNCWESTLLVNYHIH